MPHPSKTPLSGGRSGGFTIRTLLQTLRRKGTAFLPENVVHQISFKRDCRVHTEEKSINRWKKVSDNDILQYIYVRDRLWMVPRIASKSREKEPWEPE